MVSLSCIPKFVKKEIVDGWAAEALKLMLLKNSHTPNAETQHYVSDVSINEIVDTSSSPKYIAGGVTLTGKAGTYDTINAFLDAIDVSIGPGSSLRYRYGIVYKDTGNPATSPIRVQIDFKEDQVIINGNSTIQFNALGFIYVA
jgi:hypothetical protein